MYVYVVADMLGVSCYIKRAPVSHQPTIYILYIYVIAMKLREVKLGQRTYLYKMGVLSFASALFLSIFYSYRIEYAHWFIGREQCGALLSARMEWSMGNMKLNYTASTSIPIWCVVIG